MEGILSALCSSNEDLKIEATRLVSHLCRHGKFKPADPSFPADLGLSEAGKQQITASGVVVALMPSLLPSANESLQEWTLLSIRQLAESTSSMLLTCPDKADSFADETNHETIVAAGAIGPLIQFLSSTSTFSILECAADTIETLSSNGMYH